MVNTIIGVGITYGACYCIASVLFAVIGMFMMGYFLNKWTGVFKVLVGVILAVIACVAVIISIFATAIVVINFGIIALSFIAGCSGQVGQQFVNETIITFIVDVISIITTIISAKIFVNVTMTKEERQLAWDATKKHIWG